VHHYDLYRLSSAAEFAALGFEEHLGRSDVLVIEWADRAGATLPADRLLVELSLDERERERRTIVFSAAPSWADRIARLDAGSP
jgi:N-acetylmuramate 1-kinase